MLELSLLKISLGSASIASGLSCLVAFHYSWRVSFGTPRAAHITSRSLTNVQRCVSDGYDDLAASASLLKVSDRVTRSL